MIKRNWKAHSDDIAIKLIRANAMLSEPILEIGVWVQFFRKRAKKCKKRIKYLKIWTKMYKKGQLIAFCNRTQ